MKRIEAFQKVLDVYKELRDQAMKSGVPIDVFKALFVTGLLLKFDCSSEKARRIVEVLESFVSEEKGDVN